jgi:hypothetical protein
MKRIKPLDRDALERCLALARESDPLRAEQIDDKLRSEPWFEVADFACYVVQRRSLHLKPWEMPPSSAEPNEDSPEGELLRRMLAAGLSRYEPDPIAALNAASPTAA